MAGVGCRVGKGVGATPRGGRLANSVPRMQGADASLRVHAAIGLAGGAWVPPSDVPQSSSFQLTPVMKRRSIL